MSFTGGSNRSFSRKGSSASQKKDKKKKQDFHKHKIKIAEEERLDFAQLKDKVSVALEKLGNQVFSNEPGAYTFDNWMTSYNLLMDDFEERVGPSNLPKGYYDARHRLTARLLEPVDTSDIDAEVKRLEEETESTKMRISEALRKSQDKVEQQKFDNAKIEELKQKQKQSAEELEDAQDEFQITRSKQSLFSKLFSRPSPSVDSVRNRINFLKEKNEGIAQDLKRLEGNRNQENDSDNDLDDLRNRLISLQQEVGELQGRKHEREQFSEKRKQITTELSSIISGLQFKSTNEFQA